VNGATARVLASEPRLTGESVTADGARATGAAGTAPPVPPQRLLTVLMGDYWLWQRRPLPSRILMDLLAEFAVTEANARAALRRVTQRGLLELTRHGRTTAYAIPPRPEADIWDRLYRIFLFGDDADPWDGRWTVAAFSLPETERDLRRSLREELRIAGLRALFDAVWVSPLDRRPEVRRIADRLGVDGLVVGRTPLEGMTDAAVVARAFDAEEVAERYRRCLARYSPYRERVRRGDVSPRDALLIRTEVIAEWRAAILIDPGLPAELLPASWPRSEARAVVADVYDGLAGLASERVRQVIAQHAPDLAGLVETHTFAGLAAAAPVRSAETFESTFGLAADRHVIAESGRPGRLTDGR
jgi:phenylacetic acid degradation operon negative regulatory protein